MEHEVGAAALAQASRALSEGRFADAIAFAGRALAGELDRDVPSPERGERYDLPEQALAHHVIGTARLELGDRAGAVKSLSRAIELNPRSAVSFANRAVARRDGDDLAGAVDDFATAIQLRPGYIHAHSNRARVLARLGRPEEAERDYLVILRNDPRAEPSRSEWGALRASRGLACDDEALAACTKALP